MAEGLFVLLKRLCRALHKQRKNFTHLDSDAAEVLNIWRVYLDVKVRLAVEFTGSTDGVGGGTQRILSAKIRKKNAERRVFQFFIAIPRSLFAYYLRNEEANCNKNLQIIISSSKSSDCRIDISYFETFIIFSCSTKSNDGNRLRFISRIIYPAIDTLSALFDLVWCLRFPASWVLEFVLGIFLSVATVPSVTCRRGGGAVENLILCKGRKKERRQYI
jgi:hypothetical protein